MLKGRGLVGLAAGWAVAACLSGGSGGDDRPTPESPVESGVGHPGAPAMFGEHHPHGRDAVDYLYGPQGTWRDKTGLHYQWNYYEHCATTNHPANRQELIRDGSSSNVTAPDANCLILGDLDNDGAILDDHPTGHAFHEHAGHGPGGARTAAPFYQFWFDDNWIARHMAKAYGRPQPSGLHDNGYTVRWRVLGGDNRHWTPYRAAEHVDQIALNGLYRLNAGDIRGAIADWISIRDRSGSIYSAADRRYSYRSFAETYHLALWAILSERLLAFRGELAERNDVLQHAMSIRSALLSLQQKDADGARKGWITGINDPRTLINTETVSLVALALAANATWVLEPGHAPLRTETGRGFSPGADALSARTNAAQPGYLIIGPDWTLPVGTYDVQFSLRTQSPAADTRLATVDVHDGAEVLASAVVTTAVAPRGDEWFRYSLTATIANAGNRTQFRVYWPAAADLDVGPVRITRRDP